MRSILDILKTQPLLLDGAMGTELIARTNLSNEFSDRCNLSHPKVVKQIHREYLAAGSDCITANTFGGSHIAQGIALAKAAANPNTFILGSLGPVGNFESKLESFAAAGCDGIVFETFSDGKMMAEALRASKAVASWPAIASFAFRKVEEISEMIQTALDAGADVVGANCYRDSEFESLAEKIIQAAGSMPTILQPNAGKPRAIGNKFVYDVNRESMANFALRALQSGVKMVGACCGTNPLHIRAMRAGMNRLGYCPIASR